MLPFEHRPWAKPVAALVIAATVIAEAALALWLRTYGPINIVDTLAMVLFFLAVVPPNVHILRLKSPPRDYKPNLGHP